MPPAHQHPGSTIATSAIAGSGLSATRDIGVNEVVLRFATTPTSAAGLGPVNHSCDPNLGWADARTLMTIRDVAIGQELTCDYATAIDDAGWSMYCHCETYRCRQLIEGGDWQIPQLQRRYAGQWTPQLQRRIDSARPMTTVRIIDEQKSRELRRSILRPELPPGAALPGDDLRGGVHIGAVDRDGTVACTCFVYADPCPWLPQRRSWHLRQMATLAHRRGEGLGRAVVAAAVQHVTDQGADILWCNARETAVRFYTGAGFVSHGAVFTDERHPIPHVRMWRELSDAATSST